MISALSIEPGTRPVAGIAVLVGRRLEVELVLDDDDPVLRLAFAVLPLPSFSSSRSRSR